MTHLKSFILLTAVVMILGSVAYTQPRVKRVAPTNSKPQAEEATGETQNADSEELESAEETAPKFPKGELRQLPEEGEFLGDGKTVHVLRIDTDLRPNDMIDRGWHYKLHRALSAAEAAQADLFVLEINTNGGRLDAAFMMQARLLQSEIPTLAFVNSRALSAGAFIAMGADNIALTRTAKIGDALPVTPDPTSRTGMRAAEAKVISALSAQMRAAAQENGHPVDVAVAMVDPKRPLEGFSKRNELLTLTGEEAVAAGLTNVLVKNVDELLLMYEMEGAEVVVPNLSVLEMIAGQLSRQAVISALATIAFLALMLELKTPGVGIPGAVSAFCFVLIFFGSSLANLSGFLEPLLLLIGVVLLLLEFFVVPGFGVPGFAGIICVLLSVGLSTTEMPTGAEGMTATYLAPAAYTMFYSIVGFIVGVPILLKALPHIPVLNRMILEAPGADAAAAPLAPRETPLARLQIGDMGEATTALRPSGTAVFAGHKVDVVADGQFLQRGDQLVIQDISGNRVLVKARS